MSNQTKLVESEIEPCNRCTNAGKNLIGCNWLCNSCLAKDPELIDWLKNRGLL